MFWANPFAVPRTITSALGFCWASSTISRASSKPWVAEMRRHGPGRIPRRCAAAASEVGHYTGDRFCFPSRALIGAYGKGALDDLWRIALPLASRARLFRRFDWGKLRERGINFVRLACVAAKPGFTSL
jgi:hypothetical protein